MKNIKILTFTLLTLIGIGACTNLDENSLGGELTGEQAAELTSAKQFLNSAYTALQTFESQEQPWALQEHTADAVMGPTRGGDWDDNGIWRQLQEHKWTAGHKFVEDTYNNLSNGVFQSIQAISFDPSVSEEAQAQYLLAWFVFSLNDLYGQVPIREAGEDLREPSRVLNRQEAIDMVISLLETAIPNLAPSGGDPSIANQGSARTLLAKAYLNKPVYEATSPAGPYDFTNADMDQVIQNIDAVTGYSLEGDYYNNFSTLNETSSENIFVSKHIRNQPGGGVRTRWHMTLHYNQNPSGWNGFTTLSDFYSKFDDPNDVRKGGIDYPNMTEISGLKIGFLEGQQYDQNGNKLKDRLGNDLSFTIESPIISSGNTLEITGVRALKYAPDYDAPGFENPENDYVLLRYADALLMKAEALLRKGDAAGGLAIVNDIRTMRGAAPLGALDLNAMIDERGRELWWEGWRRQDLIRFGKFLDAWTEKEASGEERLLFPIPTIALSSNPNLVQNPGY